MITKKRTKEQLLSEEVLDAYINRPDFQYDVNGDALYRHYKDRYTQLGQTAMQDTMGQAAALTGGYGSSYAQNVGQQAYQGYMQQLGDVVPALYRLAYDRYRDKGETLYKTYQSLADQEQETANREHQDRIYALALKKYELEEQKDPEAAYHNQQSTEPQGAGKDYQQGKLQSRSQAGMTADAWAAHRSRQPQSSGTSKSTQAVQDFIAAMVTEDQAAERGINTTEWKTMVMDRLNRISLTDEEFAQLEKYYGLDIPGADAATPQDHTDQKLSYAQYRNKTATQKASDMNSAVQQFYNLSQAFINSAIYDMQYVGYNNAATMLGNRKKTAKDLIQQAEALLSSLRLNADIFSGECSKIIDQLVAVKTGIENIMSAFGEYAAYASDCATEEEYNYGFMSAAEIAAERNAKTAAAAESKQDYAIVWELSQTFMPYDLETAKYYGYSQEEFAEVEKKRKYIEEKYDVDLHSDIYENIHIYNGLLTQLEDRDVNIAYTTKDGQNVTWDALYNRKYAQEDLAKRLADYSKNSDWDQLSNGMDVRSDPDRKKDYDIVFELSRVDMAYDKETALANGVTEADWNDVEQKRQYINQKYGVDLHSNIYDADHILNEIMMTLDEQSWESSELSMQFFEGSDRTFMNMRHLTEDEKKVLNYIFYTQGREAALNWHNSRMEIYQDRANGALTAEMMKWGKESPFWSSNASVAMSLGSGVEQIGDWFFGDDNNSLARASSAIRAGVSEKVDLMIGNWDAFDFLYNVTMNSVDFVVSSKLPLKTGSVLSVLSVAAQATNDALDRGMSQKQVFWTGMMAGVIEGIFEIWSVGDFRALKKVASTHTKDIAINIAKTMLGKASDATIKKVANIAYDIISNGDFSEYETKVRQYVINGMTETEAKKKAALEIGEQIAEDIVSELFKEIIGK